MPLLFFHKPSNPLSFFLLQQSNDVWLWQCGMHTTCKRRWVGSVVEWAEGRGLSLRVKRVGGLVVGWHGCECDGLVSNTLSLSMSATSTHPSMVSHSAVCFKAIVFLPLQSMCWCCCVVPLLPFVQSPSHWLLSSHCCLHNELCLCWVGWCVV